MFRNLKLRGRKPGCLGCDSNTISKIQHETVTIACGTEEIAGDSRVTVKALQEVMQSTTPYIFIDTRPEVEYGICSLPNSLSEFLRCAKALQAPRLTSCP